MDGQPPTPGQARPLPLQTPARAKVTTSLSLAGCCLLAAIAALFADVEVARYCLLGKVPGDIRSALKLSELFAHGVGIVFIGLTIYVLDSTAKRRAGQVVAAALAAGSLAFVAKCCVARIRPSHFSFNGDVWTTFQGWVPAWTKGDITEIGFRAIQSMPSGHTATAVALTYVLVHHYPRGRWLFPFFAVLVMLQRITGGSHYVSDTLVAAALGIVTGIVFVQPRLLGKFFADKSSPLSDDATTTDPPTSVPAHAHQPQRQQREAA